MSVFRVTLINFDPDNDQEKEAFQKILAEHFEIAEAQVASVLANLPSILTENLSKNIAESSVKKLKDLGAVVALEEISSPAELAMKESKSEDPLDFDFNFDESFSFEEKKEVAEEPPPQPTIDLEVTTPKEVEAARETPTSELDFDFSLEPTSEALAKTPESAPESVETLTTPEPVKDTLTEKDEFDFSFDEGTKEEPISDFSFDANEQVEAASDSTTPQPQEKEKTKEVTASTDVSSTKESPDQGTSAKVVKENLTEETKTVVEKTSKTKFKKQLSNKKIQAAICSGLVILLLATFYQFDPFDLFNEQPQTTSNINSQMVDALLQEQQKILAPPVETPTPEPTPVPLEERYWESSFENEVATTNAKIFTLGSEIKQIQLDITTPKPRKLTFSEIAANKPEPVWIQRADVKIVKTVEDTLAREEKDIAFKLQGSARTFLSDSIGGERIFADIDIAGNYSKDEDKITGIWEIRYGPITNRLQDYNFVERLSKKEFAVYYKGRFTAVLTEKPKTYELSLESLQKIGVDIEQKSSGE